MKNRQAWLLAAALALLLAGCGGMKTQPPVTPGAEPGAIPPTTTPLPTTTPPPTTALPPEGQTPPPAGQTPPPGEPVPPPGEPTPLPPTPPAELTPQAAAEAAVAELGPRPPVSENRAVLALLDKARAAAGQRESAEASLERALRIEPRNPWLWHELAELRLRQGDYAQAITLARKSTSFAGGKHRVQAENWQVIGQARIAQGDSAGADQAFRQAADLAKQAKGE